MINYTWKFNVQDVAPYDINSSNSNVIKTVQWWLTGTDSQHTNKSQTMSGCISLDTSDLSDFTPINEITNSTLQSWVENRVTIDKINAFTSSLENSINTLPDDWSAI
jgi:hypothetical protein